MSRLCRCFGLNMRLSPWRIVSLFLGATRRGGKGKNGIV
jgi:hypothetical protein